MPVSERHKYKAGKVGPVTLPTKAYVILDDHHRPDLHGQFAGAKVYWNGGKQCVDLTDAQAQFYLASGSIEEA